jgi:hypothetical protein
MLRTLLALVCLASLAVAGAPRRADAAIQAPLAAASLVDQGSVARVTFWAHPYPYGYRGWRQCPRVRIETPYGWYWDRVCVEPGITVLRRAY